MSEEHRFPARPAGVPGSLLGELDLYIGTWFDARTGTLRGGWLQRETVLALREDARISAYFRRVIQAVSQFRFSAVGVDPLLIAAQHDDIIALAICPFGERPTDNILTEPTMSQGWTLFVFDKDGVCRCAEYENCDTIAAKKMRREIRTGARTAADERRRIVRARLDMERARLMQLVTHLPQRDPRRVGALALLYASDFDLVSVQLLYEILDEKAQAASLLELVE